MDIVEYLENYETRDMEHVEDSCSDSFKKTG